MISSKSSKKKCSRIPLNTPSNLVEPLRKSHGGLRLAAWVVDIQERRRLTPSDQELMELILERDWYAFETLFERYREMIRRHLVRIVRSDSAAQDLVQEVFLRVWTRAEQWNGRGPFRAWLYRIASNLALNSLRSMNRRREQPLENGWDEWNEEEEENRLPAWLIDSSTLGPDAALEQSDRRAVFRQLVEELSYERREVLHLALDMEMSIGEVAEALGVPEGTVKSRLYYAKQRLVRNWQNMGLEGEEI